MASETVENLLGRRDVKAGSFLFVKRAEPDKVRPGSLELEVRADDIDDVACVADLLDRGLRDDGQGNSDG